MSEREEVEQWLGKITITAARYEQLIRTEEQVKILLNCARDSQYGISREEIEQIFSVDLPEVEK